MTLRDRLSERAADLTEAGEALLLDAINTNDGYAWVQNTPKLMYPFSDEDFSKRNVLVGIISEKERCVYYLEID